MGEPMKMKMSATSTILPRMAVSVPAYAKINLTLELLGVRPDGYHAIRSVVVPVELHDDVEISVVPASEGDRSLSDHAISLETIADGVSLAALGPADNNLAVRAARLFLDRIGQFEFQISDFKFQNPTTPLSTFHSPLSTSLSASAPSAPLRNQNNPAPNRQTVKPSNPILHSAFCILHSFDEAHSPRRRPRRRQRRRGSGPGRPQFPLPGTAVLPRGTCRNGRGNRQRHTRDGHWRHGHDGGARGDCHASSRPRRPFALAFDGRPAGQPRYSCFDRRGLPRIKRGLDLFRVFL